MRNLMPSLLKDYRCTACGTCCFGWNIEVYPLELKQIILSMRTVPKEETPEHYGFKLSKDAEKKIKNAYFRMFENHCGFLQENKLCFLHARFGKDIKPVVCKSYPFYTIRTPDVTYLSASFSCVGACQFLLPQEIPYAIVPSQEQVDSVGSLKMDATDLKRIRLTPQSAISWQTFYTFQEHILTFPSLDIFTLLDHLWFEIQNFPNQYITHKEMHDMLAKPLEKRESKESGYVQHWNLMSRILQKLAEYEWESVLFPIQYFLSRVGIHHGDVSEEAALRYHDYMKQYNLLEQEDLQWIFNNYIRTRLFISDIYFGKNIQLAIHIMSFMVGMICLMAVAAAGSNLKVTQQDLLNAIYMAEKYLFHSSIVENWVLEDIRPRFAYP